MMIYKSLKESGIMKIKNFILKVTANENEAISPFIGWEKGSVDNFNSILWNILDLTGCSIKSILG